MPPANPAIPGREPAPTRVRWLILAALCLAAATAYVQRQCLGTVEKVVREELRLTKDEMGSILSSFFITYAALQIPAGRWAERVGTRRALTVMAGTWSAACGLVACVGGATGLVACRLLMGSAQAGIFTCTTLAIRRWFPVQRFGLANGLLAGGMQVGGFAGAALAGWLTHQLGWRLMFLIFAVPGGLWAIWFWRLFRDDPADHPAVNQSELSELPVAADNSREVAAIPWRALVRAWPLWCLCLQQFLRAGAQMFYGSWFSTYLQEERGLGLTEAGLLNSLPIATMALGPVIGGWGSDWLERRTGNRRISRQGLAAAGLMICAGLMWTGYRMEDPRTAVAVIGLGALFGSAAGPAAYTASIELGGRHVAVVFSIMNMWGNIGAAAFPKLIGRVLGEVSTGNPSAGSAADWDRVFMIFTLLYFLAALAWISFDSTRPLLKDDAAEPEIDGRRPTAS